MRISPINNYNYQTQNQNNKRQNVNFGSFIGPGGASEIEVALIRPFSEPLFRLLENWGCFLRRNQYSELSGKVVSEKGMRYLYSEECTQFTDYVKVGRYEEASNYLKGCIDGEPQEIITLESLKNEMAKKKRTDT